MIRLIPVSVALVLGSLPLACATSNGSGARGAAGEHTEDCGRRQAQCEAACQPRELPGSSEKQPMTRGDLEEERCRQRCGTTLCP
jgi:hypothetical protein